jgi:tRNA(Ile)-lysidine synthase
MSSTKDQRTVDKRAEEYLRNNEIPPGAAILVALSGGPDSLCLAAILQNLQDRYPLHLRAAYLDHGLRDESEREGELEFVRKACRVLAIELSWERLPQGLLQEQARERGGSLEEVARRARYTFLRETAERTACGYIALGHTADDQIETVVMRIFQGAGLGGLPGIPRIRGELIRPLIDCSRAEILRYLSDRGLSYLSDATNRDTRYLRNAVRRDLLPAVERIFPGFRGSVVSLSKRLASLRDYVASESRRRLDWKPVPGGVGIPGKQFLAAPGPLRLESITARINALVPDSGRVPYRFLAPVEEDEFMLSRNVVLRGYGIRLFWRGEQLILATDVVGHTEKGYFIEELERGRVHVPAAGIFFEFGYPLRETERFLFRSAKAGDAIKLEGGSIAVKSLFSHWRVARAERWKIPIVDSTSGIVAVLGGLLGYEDRFSSGLPREQGKALKSMVHRYDVEVE